MARKPEYGRGAEAFLEYERFIVDNPNYAGMPDIYTDDGGIQWEAPSNRGSGKYKDTHHKRRDWWRKKAVELGLDPNGPEWISQAAKLLHPTKRKPCKACGRVMDIRYAYPNKHLLNRLRRVSYIDDVFPIDPLEHISDLITRLAEQFGDGILADLPELLATGSIKPKPLPTLEAWLRWIDSEYIPQEPQLLSPGVMSNAPDRLDGFHSFNLCCRSKSDTGRAKENLQSYTTDRRVFEYWVEGDWVAADRLMGLVRSSETFKAEACLNGHAGPCSADHIGPISLGFVHRPVFQLLCKACNSAKNNRMTAGDVEHLRAATRRGEVVTSWYCRNLWHLRSDSVVDDETALRLSKLLRDNRHTVMEAVFGRLAGNRHFAFLSTFLELEHAMYDVAFVNLRTENHITVYDEMIKTPRSTKYAGEQKARRLRVAFAALRDYVQKENRNAYVIGSRDIEARISDALQILDAAGDAVVELNGTLYELLNAPLLDEERLRRISSDLPTRTAGPAQFEQARGHLQEAMDLVGAELSELWNDERYVRARLDDVALA